MTQLNNGDKLTISLRYWLQGRGYFQTLEAMDWAGGYHSGFRKDGVTPEFLHQVQIAHYVRTLSNVRDMPAALTTVMLHDLREDHGIAHEEVERRFGSDVAGAVDCLTKEFRGHRHADEKVFERIGNNAIASVVKGADRIHNMGSMVGVFKVSKQKEYVHECKRLFLPMLKTARRAFPDQEPCYENIKMMLKSQISLIESIHTTQGE